jgi:hypothetical protein
MNSQLMSVPQPRVIKFGWLSVIAWAALTAMGFLAAVVLHFPGNSDLPIFDLSAAVLGFVFGAISGAITALFQLLVLKPWLRSPWQWLVANGIAWGLVHALNDGIGVHPQVASALAALTVALTQTIALRHYLANGLLWLLGSWASNWDVLFSMAKTPAILSPWGLWWVSPQALLYTPF